MDVDGNAQPDVVFKSTNVPSGGQGQPSTRTFRADVRTGRRAERKYAIDDKEFDSVHRFVAGDQIGPGLRWRNVGGGFLDYTITGNGGTGGRGFFRSNASGFVAFRKSTGGQMRYWWFYIEPRIAATDAWISYYAGTSVVLATHSSQPAFAVLPYPNPTISCWKLLSAVKYQLFDGCGRLVSSVPDKPATLIQAERLPSGLYALPVYRNDGTVGRQAVVKE